MKQRKLIPLLGLGLTLFLSKPLIKAMDKATNEIAYQSPVLEMIEVKVEKGFVNSNVENPKEGETSNW